MTRLREMVFLGGGSWNRRNLWGGNSMLTSSSSKIISSCLICVFGQ